MRKLLCPVLCVLLALQVSGAKAEKIDVQVRDQLEYKKGRCLAAIVVTSKRVPENLASAFKQFSDENMNKGITLLQRVRQCVVAAGRDTPETHNSCAQKLGPRDSSFYLGFMILADQALNWPRHQILAMQAIECGDFSR